MIILTGIDQYIECLEDHHKHNNDDGHQYSISGTSISRAYLDKPLALAEGFAVPENKEALFVWCLGIGEMNRPLIFSYGRTIKECCQRMAIKLNFSP